MQHAFGSDHGTNAVCLMDVHTPVNDREHTNFRWPTTELIA